MQTKTLLHLLLHIRRVRLFVACTFHFWVFFIINICGSSGVLFGAAGEGSTRLAAFNDGSSPLDQQLKPLLLSHY